MAFSPPAAQLVKLDCVKFNPSSPPLTQYLIVSVAFNESLTLMSVSIFFSTESTFIFVESGVCAEREKQAIKNKNANKCFFIENYFFKKIADLGKKLFLCRRWRCEIG